LLTGTFVLPSAFDGHELRVGSNGETPGHEGIESDGCSAVKMIPEKRECAALASRIPATISSISDLGTPSQILIPSSQDPFTSHWAKFVVNEIGR
jgi:hypothetical protein